MTTDLGLYNNFNYVQIVAVARKAMAHVYICTADIYPTVIQTKPRINKYKGQSKLISILTQTTLLHLPDLEQLQPPSSRHVLDT